MRLVLHLAPLLCLPGFLGCATPHSEAPIATNFPTTLQPKLQAAAHWDVIAKDVASQITPKLAGKQALYVTPPSSGTEFERAFVSQLISALVNEGYTVQKAPEGALAIEVTTQAVRFSANRPQYRHVGVATALTAGVWTLHQAEVAGIASGQTLALAGVLAGAAALDAHSWFHSKFATGETPRMEIIVTTSVSDASRYLARNSAVYYVADQDRFLYDAPKTKTMEVTGGGGK